jgi:5-bromo-4-chloroindolyl phosphate hydrolysis protein
MMAERFGGKFSPDNARPSGTPDPLTAAPTGRISILFVVAFAFVAAAFLGDGPRDLVLGLSAFAGIILGAWLTRDGLIATAAFDARRVARRPALPRKAFGAVLTGTSLTMGGLMSQPGLAYPITFGLLGAALHVAAFGLDPWRAKGVTGIDDFQTDRIARAVEDAEDYLRAMKDAVLRANDRGIEARVDRFAATARTLFRGIEADPGDLTAARKYLTVYLMGARDAAVKFADLYAQTRDPQTKADFEALLDDLETTFAARTTSLLSDNRSDLDIEISVLRERLARET